MGDVICLDILCFGILPACNDHFFKFDNVNNIFIFMGENYGVKFTSPIISAVLIATIPLFAPIIAYLKFKEKLSWINIIRYLYIFCRDINCAF